MFSRHPEERLNRGRVQQSPRPGGAPPVTPLTILGSLAWWVRADLGITTGTGVSAWADQSGNGVDFTQGTGSAQPALVAGTINGQPAVSFDGIDDWLSAAYVPPAPPMWYWLVFRPVTIVNGLTTFASGGGRHRLAHSTVNRLAMVNITSVNLLTATPGAYARGEISFSNSLADYLKVGSASVTGANAGANPGSAGFFLGSGASGVGPSRVEIAEAFGCVASPSAGQRADLDAYCTARYGAGLV